MKLRGVFTVALALAMSGALSAAEPAAPSAAQLYKSECGSCHLAYPAAMLPARSWKKLMGDLANHFGDNAELGAATRAQITDYLLAGGDKNVDRHAARFAASAASGETPLRITALPYFKREHHEIPQRYIKGNEQVGSLSNCAACHTRAEQGSFREREIVIPGIGHWEDD